MSHISLSEIKEIYNMYITVTPIQNLLEQTALSQITNLAERYQCNQQILKFHNIGKDSCVLYIVVLSLIGRIFFNWLTWSDIIQTISTSFRNFTD